MNNRMESNPCEEQPTFEGVAAAYARRGVFFALAANFLLFVLAVVLNGWTGYGIALFVNPIVNLLLAIKLTWSCPSPVSQNLLASNLIKAAICIGIPLIATFINLVSIFAAGLHGG